MSRKFSVKCKNVCAERRYSNIYGELIFSTKLLCNLFDKAKTHYQGAAFIIFGTKF